VLRQVGDVVSRIKRRLHIVGVRANGNGQASAAGVRRHRVSNRAGERLSDHAFAACGPLAAGGVAAH
jgi:hypothetical protein